MDNNIDSLFHPCTACGEPSFHDICLPCVQARARTVGNRGKCTCKKAFKRPRTVTNRIRTWVACDRCLGTIKQLS